VRGDKRTSVLHGPETEAQATSGSSQRDRTCLALGARVVGIELAKECTSRQERKDLSIDNGVSREEPARGQNRGAHLMK